MNTIRPETDAAFECNAIPSTSRSLPTRSCKQKNTHYEDNSSSDDEPIRGMEDKNFDDTEQPNLIESTKNSIQDEENVNIVEDENEAEPFYYYEENSYEDSDPYGYGAEMLGQHFTSSDDVY